MAGIYIHYPYCKQKCHYCNFFSLATHKFRNEFVDALLEEISQRKTYIKDPVQSIYFGGGTPSLLSVDEIQRIMDHLTHSFSVDSSAEITLEANPDDLDIRYLKDLQKTDINRLSIGIQSFNNDELMAVNRVHNAESAMDCVKNAQDAGFGNLSIDLIYGIPNSTAESWRKNLEITHSLQAPHLSAYSLTQETRTAYDVLVKKGKLLPPNDEKAIEQYQMLQDYLPVLGMEQYEISNYARPNHQAVHNTNYWKGIPYLGLGPSAHSFDGKSRRWNKAHLTDYLAISMGKPMEFEEEILSLSNRWNEWIMTGLRTKWGVDTAQISSDFPDVWIDLFEQKAHDYIQKNMMFREKSNYRLTERGKFFADAIAMDFFEE